MDPNLDTETDPLRRDDVKRDGEKMATYQARNAGGHQELKERPRTDSPLQLLEGTNPTNTLVLDN